MKLITVILLALLMSCSNDQEQDLLAEKVGYYLLEETLSESVFSKGALEHPNIIRLGAALGEQLKSLRSNFSANCKTEVVLGDNKAGDGTASHHIFIICEQVKNIGIRLKYDREKRAFHILGYWTRGL
ncbi:hypothetical protein [Thalassomonas haliotis]|uniref:Lipoprotein n=1 Tax=Thalassomonas haliotis TaxID=485448 RepID=A0ABY7V6V0_9GAMM|nr:hypothetical protein [Thalassomonas haliotis]WDE09361.1 hypothetical protein H3N35_13540 [Thalassomonas haliotis]